MNLRDIEVFRPYADEYASLLDASTADPEATLAQWQTTDIVRLAKRQEEVLGVYAMQRHDALNFELLGVIVDPAVRRQGLGRWLVGHAIGVCESKGGRLLRAQHVHRLFRHLGFVDSGQGMQLELISEG